MHDTKLNMSIWENGVNGIRKILEAIYTSDKDIFHATLLKFRQHV